MAVTVEERPVARKVKGFAEGISPTVRMSFGSVRIGNRFHPVKLFSPQRIPP